MFQGKPNLGGMTSIGERGQVVIPQKVREELGLNKGDQFVVFSKGKNFIGLVREEKMTEFLKTLVTDIEKIKNAKA